MASALVIPENYQEMVKFYNPCVSKAIRKFVCHGETEEDLLQKIWMRLLEAKVLEKYLESQRLTLPRVFSLDQVLDVFSIQEQDWLYAETCYAQFLSEKYYLFYPKNKGRFWSGTKELVSWMPTPTRGQYRVEDLFEVYDLGIFPNRTLSWPERVESPNHFVGYLLTAVSNFCRNHKRDVGRHLKERGPCAFGKQGNRLYDPGSDDYDFDRLAGYADSPEALVAASQHPRIRQALSVSARV